VVRQANAAPQELSGELPVGQTLDDYISEQERRYIEETIRFHAGNREKAAKTLGISMATLYRKLGVKRVVEKA
jgi:DNA-binding NtrC family response regulator